VVPEDNKDLEETKHTDCHVQSSIKINLITIIAVRQTPSNS